MEPIQEDAEGSPKLGSLRRDKKISKTGLSRNQSVSGKGGRDAGQGGRDAEHVWPNEEGYLHNCVDGPFLLQRSKSGKNVKD